MEWRYHLGVHKTATTHIQRVLQSQREALLAQGIDYIPLDELRGAERLFRKREPFKKIRFRRMFHPAAPVVLLSEENWLGPAQDGCVIPIYPQLEKRLSIVARENAIAFLAIRNPADFAASVYSEAMRYAPDKVALDATRRAFLCRGSPWSGLVERVSKFFPRVRVWRYEDYRGNEEAVISMVAGAQVTSSEIAPPPETRRLPDETIQALEGMRLQGKGIPALGPWVAPLDSARFEMFSEQEKSDLTKAYESDINILAEKGVLVSPHWTWER